MARAPKAGEISLYGFCPSCTTASRAPKDARDERLATAGGPPAGAGSAGRNEPWPRRVAVCMATVGFIGSGKIGGTVARLSVAAGYDVVMSNSRGPQTLTGLVGELGRRARAATGEQAAREGDLVVVTIPLKAYPSVPAAPLAGKLVLDTCNYYPQRDGQLSELDNGSLTSSELIQRHLAGAQVVKVFNNIYYRHLLSLARPAGAAGRSFLPIAGDDAEAKARATAFLDAIGFGAVDTGPLAESWRQEPGTPVYGSPYGEFSDPDGTPASEHAVRDALTRATRSP
jgi:8-hydroxy-5-deazaflavin:NADPH oxidoreductase